jgi:hypothetical protein
MGTLMTSPRVNVARTVAQMLLRDLPDRWAHSAGVADKAAQLAVTVDPAEQELLVVAAWLHDIGYSHALDHTGFHPLDGATYLHQHGWPMPVCGLVAHHSGAIFIARARHLDAALGRFPYEHSPASDALTYADQTTGPDGRPMTIDERVTEMLTRRGPDSIHARVNHQREPYLRAIATRVEQRLATTSPEFDKNRRNSLRWNSGVDDL